jgi:hypothetical protein
MSPFQLGAALVALAGALVALSARDIRLALGGVVVAMAVAALVADPIPSPLAVAVRLVAAGLGAELVLIAVRHRPADASGSPIGPLSPLLAGAAAFVVGYATSGVGSPAAGPPAATAAGFGLAALAIGPLVYGRDVVRVGLGMALLVTAIELVRAGLAGTPTAVEQLATAALSLAVLGLTAVLVSAALAANHSLAIEGEGQRTTLFEAHPVAAGAPLSTPRGQRRPAAAPRPDGAAHQLTLEERLRRSASEPDDSAG